MFVFSFFALLVLVCKTHSMILSPTRVYVGWICIGLICGVIHVAFCTRTRLISNRVKVASEMCCCKANPCGKMNPLKKQHIHGGVAYCCKTVEANFLGMCPFGYKPALDKLFRVLGESACPTPTASKVKASKSKPRGKNILEERMGKLRSENVQLHARYKDGSWQCVPLRDWQEPLVSKLLSTDFDHDIGGDPRWEELNDWKDASTGLVQGASKVYYKALTNSYRMQKNRGSDWPEHTLYVDSLCQEKLTPEWGRSFLQTRPSV
eukprot:TRINITY_DN47323_c0_g1_i1.p1 TRINITY_DN47323_c0_g1~~TRINITY_DN47323_c0_g1_i1.p1  ORF type:complete len:264 (-),score=17.95 TRINITY_DN47323_c0_g1_i1:162-953(-)